MRILFFIPRMGGGGAERVVANLSNEFCRRGDSVVIYTPTTTESYYSLNQGVHLVSEGYFVSKKKFLRQICFAFNGIRLFFAYGRRIKKEKPDAVISFISETNQIALLHRHKKYRLVVSERCDPTQRGKLKQWIIKKLYSRADVLVCQSKIVADYFGSANTVVIPNPIDSSILPGTMGEAREKRIVAVGRLDSQKNFASLIKAFSNVVAESEFSDYKLEIYGEGELRPALQNLMDSLKLTERAKLMGSKKNVLECIKNAALFVMSSDFEGYPNALAEAMAVGLPVVSTDFYTGTARELVGKDNGILVPVGDSDSLADAIKIILSDDSRREKMGMENLKLRDTLSINNIADMWYKVM